MKNINEPKARAFNAAQLAAGKLRTEHVTELVAHWQETHSGLAVDGWAGDETIPNIERAIAEREKLDAPPPFPAVRCNPLRLLPDGRAPTVTSAFYTRNPDRPNHVGVDVCYRYIEGKDPAMKIGDGGRSPKWWVPLNHKACAVADGRVALAGWTKTGYFVRLALADGWSVGYFHLERLTVVVGQFVQLGEVVGFVGDNPVDKDIRHLHFEVYRGHTGWLRVDPQPFLEGAKLLPAVP